MFTFISDAFTHGGVWMYGILTVHIFSIAIIIERIYFLYMLRGTNQKKSVRVLEEDIKRGQIDLALSKAQSLSQSQSVGVIATAGIQAAINLGGKDEIYAKMEEMANIENSKLEKRTSLLSMIGNVSTLIGLLGTITGMIKSFSAVSLANGAEKATILSTGISEAMNCTAYGLIVAIPALVMFAVLNNRTHELQDDLNQASTKVLNWLSYSYENVPRSTKRKSV